MKRRDFLGLAAACATLSVFPIQALREPRIWLRRAPYDTELPILGSPYRGVSTSYCSMRRLDWEERFEEIAHFQMEPHLRDQVLFDFTL